MRIQSKIWFLVLCPLLLLYSCKEVNTSYISLNAEGIKNISYLKDSLVDPDAGIHLMMYDSTSSELIVKYEQDKINIAELKQFIGDKGWGKSKVNREKTDTLTISKASINAPSDSLSDTL